MKIGDVATREVATGGDPAVALAAATADALDPVEPGSVNVVEVAHDGGCPCVSGTRSIDACTCEVVRLTWKRVA